MATARQPVSRPRIIRNPKVCGGEPTLAGTRVPISSIVTQWRFYRSLDRVLEAYPHLDIPSVEKALAYYAKHRDEIDRIIEDRERAANSAK